MTATITVDAMRDKLLTLDEVKNKLGASEPMAGVPFTVGDAIRFRALSGWNHGIKALDGSDPVNVFVTLGLGKYTREYQLTKSCVFEVCAAFRLRRDYVEECPADLLVPAMNYWLREGLHGRGKSKTDYQFLMNGDLATAFTKQGIQPFSNLALLDQLLAGIADKCGQVEVLADYKMSHTLRQTSVRLIIPNGFRVIESDTPDDIWSTGIQFKNSLTGASQTKIEGYLFRWRCTNGQIDERHGQAVSRRKDATEDEVYRWARDSVDQILGGLESSLDAVQALTGLHIEGSLSDTLRDVFAHYKIPIHQRSKIIKLLEEYPGEITMYVIMNAITQVANEQGLDASTVEGLLRVGGDLPHTADQRCGACHRMLHHH